MCIYAPILIYLPEYNRSEIKLVSERERIPVEEIRENYLAVCSPTEKRQMGFSHAFVPILVTSLLFHTDTTVY